MLTILENDEFQNVLFDTVLVNELCNSKESLRRMEALKILPLLKLNETRHTIVVQQFKAMLMELETWVQKIKFKQNGEFFSVMLQTMAKVVNVDFWVFHFPLLTKCMYLFELPLVSKRATTVGFCIMKSKYAGEFLGYVNEQSQKVNFAKDIHQYIIQIYGQGIALKIEKEESIDIFASDGVDQSVSYILEEVWQGIRNSLLNGIQRSNNIRCIIEFIIAFSVGSAICAQDVNICIDVWFHAQGTFKLSNTQLYCGLQALSNLVHAYRRYGGNVVQSEITLDQKYMTQLCGQVLNVNGYVRWKAAECILWLCGHSSLDSSVFEIILNIRIDFRWRYELGMVLHDIVVQYHTSESICNMMNIYWEWFKAHPSYDIVQLMEKVWEFALTLGSASIPVLFRQVAMVVEYQGSVENEKSTIKQAHEACYTFLGKLGSAILLLDASIFSESGIHAEDVHPFGFQVLDMLLQGIMLGELSTRRVCARSVKQIQYGVGHVSVLCNVLDAIVASIKTGGGVVGIEDLLN